VQKAGSQILEDFGRVDILVNNAGVTRDGLSMRMSQDDWDIVLDTNLKGAFNFAQALMRPMIKQRSGRIINISSISGLIGNAGQANYAASKAGLIGLTKTLAREAAFALGKNDQLEEGGVGLTVNCVAPGFVATRLHETTLAAGPATAGADYYELTRRELAEGGVPAAVAAELVCLLLGDPEPVPFTGRLISAQWDPWRDPRYRERLATEHDLATLRRIDGVSFARVPEDRPA
jgi:NAD(P)-dependent dehydrogenase (short-subunit alcohol dehydrogenase family)